MGSGPAELGEFMRRDGVEPSLIELVASVAAAADRIEALRRLPPGGRTYAVNSGRRAYWTTGVRAFVDDLTADDGRRGRPYSLRYSGSLTADLHRILLEGGVYYYPGDAKAADGTLRLLYEASPLALLAEQGGGRASSGRAPILDIIPRTIHERVPLYIGSVAEVELAEAYVRQEGAR